MEKKFLSPEHFLAEEFMTGSLTEREASQFLNVSVWTLRSWRSKGRGPNYYRVGTRAIRYSAIDLMNFFIAGKVDVSQKEG